MIASLQILSGAIWNGDKSALAQFTSHSHTYKDTGTQTLTQLCLKTNHNF